MTFVVIGLGSMGRRRIRLLKGLEPHSRILGVDLSKERRQQAEKEFEVRTYSRLATAVAKGSPQAALVCTSPASHGPIALECLAAGLHVFTELNLLSDWYDEALALAARRRLRIFVSSTFLYRRELQFVARSVKRRRVDYIYHSGQYLPDWHPWESYRDFFVSQRETNACREIMAIELPWIVRAFGAIKSIQVMCDRNSSLAIDFPDNYLLMIRHKNGSKGVFCQDVIARKGLRRLEVYSEGLHLFWDGTPDTLSVYDLGKRKLTPVSLYRQTEHREGYNANIIEDAYRDELVAFLKYIRGRRQVGYTLDDDRKILDLIDGIERGDYGR